MLILIYVLVLENYQARKEIGKHDHNEKAKNQQYRFRNDIIIFIGKGIQTVIM